MKNETDKQNDWAVFGGFFLAVAIVIVLLISTKAIGDVTGLISGAVVGLFAFAGSIYATNASHRNAVERAKAEEFNLGTARLELTVADLLAVSQFFREWRTLIGTIGWAQRAKIAAPIEPEAFRRIADNIHQFETRYRRQLANLYKAKSDLDTATSKNAGLVIGSETKALKTSATFGEISAQAIRTDMMQELFRRTKGEPDGRDILDEVVRRQQDRGR